jgi:hypothetical protein
MNACQYGFRRPNENTNYIKYQKFAPTLSPVLETDPIGSSLYSDIDSYFDIGPSAKLYGPQSESSQLYMAQKCSEKWDGSCEFLSNNIEAMKDNRAKIASPQFSACNTLNSTVGDTLVDNAAQRKFCSLGQCNRTIQKYNPLDPNSPDVITYECGDNNIICLPPSPKNSDSNVLLNKVLNKPDKHLDLLLNMYRNVGKDKTTYTGTRIGKVFDVFDAWFALH